MAGKKIMNQTEELISEGVGSFYQVLKDFNVIGFVLGLLIANSVAEIANSFIDGIIMPSLEPLLSKIRTKEAHIKIGGLNLHLEKFINSLLKFFALALIIFILLQFGVKMSRPLTWVRVEQIKDGLKM